MSSFVKGTVKYFGAISYSGSLAIPLGALKNAHVANDANNRISADKLVHRYELDYGQADGSDVVSATKVLRIAQGPGDLKSLQIRPTTAPSGGDKQYTIDVQWSADGSSSWTTLLQSVVTVDSSSVDDTLQTATLAASPTTTKGDAIRVVVTASGSTGGQGQGFTVTAVYEEEHTETRVPYTHNLQIWLAADLGLTEVDHAVSVWANQVDGGVDFSQSTASKRPKKVDAVINGHPVVRFDGSNDGLQSPSVALGKAVHVFVVVKTSGAADVILEQSPKTDPGENDGFFMYTGFPCWRVSGASTDVQVSADAAWDDGSPHVAEGIGFDGTDIEAKKDGTSVGTTATDPGAVGADVINLGSRNDGASLVLDGDIAEVLIYDEVLTAAHATLVRDYLTDRYGI